MIFLIKPRSYHFCSNGWSRRNQSVDRSTDQVSSPTVPTSDSAKHSRKTVICVQWISRQHSAIVYKVSLNTKKRELFSSSARSSSSVSIKLHRSTSRSCAFQLQRVPVTATCALPLVGTYKCLPVGHPASDHAALLPVLQNCGTVCHRHFVIQHWHLHFSVAHLFGLAYGCALVTAQAVRAARYKFSHTYIHIQEQYLGERWRRLMSIS